MHRKKCLKHKTVAVMFIAAACSLFLLIMGCSQDLPREAVAVIGDEQLTQDDLFSWIHPIGYQKLSKEKKKDTLQQFVDYQIVLKELQAIGGDRDEALVKKVENWRLNRLRKLLYREEVAGEVFSEASLRALYDDLKWRRNVNFIMIRFLKERSKEEAYEIAREVYEKARTMDFEELAREYSDKPSHKENGGSLGWVERYGLMNADLDSIIWSLEAGEISEPSLSGNEYLIVKVNQEEKVKMATFEESQDYLKEYAVFAWRERLLEYDKKYQKEMEAKVSSAFDQEGIDRFIANFTSVFDTIKTDKSLKNDPVGIIEKIDQPIHIGSYGSIEMNRDWLLDKLSDQQDLVTPVFTRKSRFMVLLDDIVFLDLLDFRVRELGLDKKSGYKRSYQNYYLRIAYQHYFTNYIYKDVEPTEAEVKAYYEKHKNENDRYKTLEKVRLQVIRVSSQELANQVYQRAAAGEEFSDLAAEFHETNQAFKDKNGFLPSISKNNYGPVGRSAFDMKVGEIHEPVKYGKSYIVIHMLERLPPVPKFYNEIRKEVKRDCWQERLPETRRSEIDRLRKKYGVKLNEGFLMV